MNIDHLDINDSGQNK